MFSTLDITTLFPTTLTRPSQPVPAMLFSNSPDHERLLHALVSTTATHLAWVTHDLRWGYVNPAAAHALGDEASKLVGRPIRESTVHNFNRSLQESIQHVLESGHTCECEALIDTPHSAQPRWMRVQVQPYTDDMGNTLGAIVMSRDVHDEVSARSTAFAQNELIERHLNNGHVAFFQMDRLFRVQRWSKAAQKLFGWTAEEAIGRRLLEICPIHPEDHRMVRQALRAVDRASNDAQVHIRSRTRTKAGDIVWVDWYASRVVIPELDAESVLFFTLDVTESVEARASLTHAARYDSLTLIPNRQSFYDWLEQHQVTDSPHGHVLFIDLDGFKEVNDRYGHHAGDRLLQNVATRLTRLLSANDFCARYGGDEFTLFVAERPSAPPISMVAENIISELRRPFEVGELNIELSCSVGIASTRDHAQDPQAIVSSADLAMFQAKANGRDQYTLYSQTLGDRHRRRSHLHAGLRDALRSGEISVAFQPRVDITSGQIVGAEALARWTQTDGTVVAPNDFIPVAEETGLIHDLGAFVLQQSCELARHVNEQQVGPTPRFVVSVNLSTIQLRQPQFVQRAKAIFASAGCLPNWIEFEVTESRELTDPVCLDRLVDLVERFGAKCSLDDFGTGYSNLMELTHLPLTALKIDRSFVSNLTKTNSSVVAAVIALGHSLKIDVVAEGVETADQLDQLRTMGASSYQGYFHSRPEPRAILCRTLGVTNP